MHRPEYCPIWQKLSTQCKCHSKNDLFQYTYVVIEFYVIVWLQTTEVESVRELPLDYVIANSLDMKGIQGSNMTCTSCKAKEKAVARCSDCANFLCPNCVTAHQFMRCFENHKVNLIHLRYCRALKLSIWTEPRTSAPVRIINWLNFSAHLHLYSQNWVYVTVIFYLKNLVWYIPIWIYKVFISSIVIPNLTLSHGQHRLYKSC